MITIRNPHKHLCVLAAALLVSAADLPIAAAQQPTATFHVVFNFEHFGGGPASFIESEPGIFYGVNETPASQTVGATLFVYKLNGGSVPLFGSPGFDQIVGFVQASNGRFYTTEVNQTTGTTFAMGKKGGVTNLPTTATPSLMVQTPEGHLYGWGASPTGPKYTLALVKLDLAGNQTIVYTASNSTDGTVYEDLVLASDGNFYGQSRLSGNLGSVYRVTPTGTFTSIATYPDGLVQGYPALIQASNGRLYGTSAKGGANNAGLLFELTLDGNLKTLYNFPRIGTGIPNGLLEANDGNIYVIAQGSYQTGANGYSSILQLNPATGTLTTIYEFKNPYDGMYPTQLLQGSDGLIYGISNAGGAVGNGNIFSLDLGLAKPVPTLHGVEPAQGAVGAKVLLYGKNLLGSTAVSFGGVPATVIENLSVNYVSAVVPAGAASGTVEITTPNGTATTSGFVVQ